MSRNLRLLQTALLAVLLVTAGRSIAQRKAAAERLLAEVAIAPIAALQSEPLSQSSSRRAAAVAVPPETLERVEVVVARQRSGGAVSVAELKPCPVTAVRRRA
jgi:hypothetical protein